MTDDELDLVSTEDLAKALARRSEAIVLHLTLNHDAESDASWPFIYGNVFTCYGLSMQLARYCEAQLDEPGESHDDNGLPDAG